MSTKGRLSSVQQPSSTPNGVRRSGLSGAVLESNAPDASGAV